MVSTFRLLLRHLRSGVGVSVLIALLVAVTVLVVALAPRALVRLGTDELRFELGQRAPEWIDLAGSGTVAFGSGPSTVESLVGTTDQVIKELPASLAHPLADGVGDAGWILRTSPVTTRPPNSATTVLVLKLAIDLTWRDRVHFVDGAPPEPRSAPLASPSKEQAPVEIALSKKTADAMGLAVGDIIAAQPAPYRLSGVYEIDPDDGYWRHARDLYDPEIIQDPSSPLKIAATAFVDPGTLIPLKADFTLGELSAWMIVDPSVYTFAEREQLAAQVREFTATPVELPSGGQVVFSTEMDGVLTATRNRVAAISALIALSGSGFVGVLIATYALGIQALIRRRQVALALAAARGATTLQVRAVMTLEAALIAIPGSVAAICLAAVLLPEAVGVDGWVGPAVVAVIPVLLAAIMAGMRFERGRTDELEGRRRSSARWVLEVAVAAVAVIAVVLLQRRGLIASSAAVGVDPLLSSTPLLLAAAVGLGVMRLLPIPLRALSRLLRRRTAPTGSFGAARATRDPAIGLVATLALVTGISIVVFTTIMISTIGAGLRQAARDEVGADMQIAAHDLPDSLVTQLTGLPEVGAATALTIKADVAFSDDDGPTEVTVVLADTTALHKVRPDIPDISAKVDGRLPILVSENWAPRIRGTDVSVVNSQAAIRGVLPSEAIPGVGRNWLLVDSAAKDELHLEGQTASAILASVARGHSSAAAAKAATRLVTAAQPQGLEGSVVVDTAAAVLAQTRAAPVVAGLEWSLVAASAATLALTVLVVALASLTAAASRNRVVGVLRILGMSPRQVRSLIAWEFAPVAISAVVVGVGLGIGLPYLITSVLDLRGFVGGTAIPQPAIEPFWIVMAVAVFVLVVVAAASIATVVGRRTAPAGTLKMGEE